jgi:hypothetical protein
VHAAGRRPDPTPLVLTHGWPGSFCQYLDVIPLLTDRQAHGRDADDAFHLVVPSLPGFGFSAAPSPGGLTAEQVAELWHRLMADGSGHRRTPRTAASWERASVLGWPGRTPRRSPASTLRPRGWPRRRSRGEHIPQGLSEQLWFGNGREPRQLAERYCDLPTDGGPARD